MGFVINSNLTVIKSVEDARKVIDSITINNMLSVEIKDDTFMVFEYDKEAYVGAKESGIAIREVNKDSTPFNMINMVHDKDYASRRLYAIRKAFNNMWKD